MSTLIGIFKNMTLKYLDEDETQEQTGKFNLADPLQRQPTEKWTKMDVINSSKCISFDHVLKKCDAFKNSLMSVDKA